MIHGKTIVFFVVCLASFQAVNGFNGLRGGRFRRQVGISPASEPIGISPASAPVNGSGIMPIDATVNGTGNMTAMPAAAGGPVDNATIMNATGGGIALNSTPVYYPSMAASSGGAAGSAVPLPIDQRVQGMLSGTPDCPDQIEADFTALMINALGLDPATASSLTYSQLKIRYIIYLIDSDPFIETVFENLRTRLATMV